MMAFLDMGGYGFYVWGSYGVAAVLMLAEPLLVSLRHRQTLRDAARDHSSLNEAE